MIFPPSLIFALVVSITPNETYEGFWCGQDSGEILRLNGTSNVEINSTIQCNADSVVDVMGDGVWTGTLACTNSATGDQIAPVTIRIEILNSSQIVVTPRGRAAETYDYCS